MNKLKYIWQTIQHRYYLGSWPKKESRLHDKK